MMIDLHAHILPGLDDGPAAMAEALEMARMAVKDGIRTVMATPHCFNGLYNNHRKNIMAACSTFNTALEKNRIPLEVLPGAEVRLDVEILNALEDGRLMTLNDTGRYFFLELPDQFILPTVTGFISKLKEKNVTPIIAHPERNSAIQRDVSLLHELVAAGALSQITGRSLTGGFGFSAFESCVKMIGLNLVHFMATDAHSSGTRPPRLSKAVLKLSALTGRAVAESMVSDTPGMVIEGKQPEVIIHKCNPNCFHREMR